MLKKISDFLAGVPMTVIGGVFLIISFTLSRMGIDLSADPAWITVIICGIPLLYLALWRIIYNPGISKISSALLIVVAMFAAIAIGDLFAAGEVAFIMALGAILEDMTTNRAKKGLKQLMELTPSMGRRIVNGKEEMISAEKIEKNDILRIFPGEAVPVDGVLIKGATSVDQSVMTGESLPVDKEAGDEVYCGTINCFGAIDIRATKVGKDSSLQKMIQLVREAEDKKAPMARIADRAASWLVPLAVLIAVAAGCVTGDIVRAVTVLVVFCPCALVLATPTAIMAAIGQATKHGVIIKSGEALENMGRVHTIAFDKTGTLTYGKLEVCDRIPFDGKISRDELLSLAACAEAKSEHPLGKAIVAYAKKEGVAFADSDSFWMAMGKGVYAEAGEQKIFCGNEKFLEENGVAVNGGDRAELERLRAQGKAAVLVAVPDRCLGVIALSDVIRPKAKETVQKLSAMNTKTVLLTGDHERAADYFANQAGITEVYARLLPEEKAEKIIKLQNSGHCICMIGDGVNDAPALKTANVGVAMGSMGSDIAVEVADIALMSDDISKIPYLKRLSDATVNTIKFSIGLSMCINAAAVTCSVLGILNPTTGALVHNAGSVFVVMIAALLYERKF